MSLKLKGNGSINHSVLTVDDLANISNPEENDICIVTDENRGGTFIYRGTGTDDGGTIFSGWHRQYDGAVQASWFDLSTAALRKSFIETFPNIEFNDIDLVLEATTQVTLTQDTTIKFKNSILTSNAVIDYGFEFLESSFKLTIDGLEMDGNASIRRGIVVHHSCEIKNCKLHNFYSDLNACIGVYIPLENNHSVSIHNNEIYDTDAVYTGVTGDGTGASRAIYVRYSGASLASNVNIFENKLYDCYGREGDTIHISEVGDYSLSSNVTYIENNFIGQGTRRCVKAQCRQIIFRNNDIESLLDTDPLIQESAGMLSMFPTDTTTFPNNKNTNSVVTGNTFMNRGGTSNSLILNDCKTTNITGNTFRWISGPYSALNIDSGNEDVYFSNNYVDCATSIGLYDSNNTTVSNNTFKVIGNCRSIVETFNATAEGTVFSNNIITFDETLDGTTPSFLGVFYFRTDVAVNNFVVSDNIIQASRITLDNRAALTYGASNITVSGFTFKDNHREGNNGLFYFGAGEDYTGCNFLNNSSSNMKYVDWIKFLGPNMFTNGEFDTATTGWVLGTGATYIPASKSVNLVDGSLYQEQTIVLGTMYQIDFEVTEVNKGVMAIYEGAYPNNPIVLYSKGHLKVGHYSVKFKAVSNTDRITFFRTGSTGLLDISIRNLKLRELI